MSYAANNSISQSPIPGGIEITQEQYAEALAGMLEGKVVSVDGGFTVAFPPEPEPDPEPEPTTEELWAALRAERDRRFEETRWLIERHAEELALDLDTTLTPEQHTDLLTYRQALRDLPESTGDPADVVWPVNPLE